VGALEVKIRHVKPSLFARICNGWKVGLTTIISLTGLVSFLLTLFTPQKLDLRIILLILLVTTLPGIIAAFLRGKQKLLPDTIIDELSSENTYVARFCLREGLREADEMTKPYFGKRFIPFDLIEQWRLKNEKGFVQINNSDGLLCSCFVILGLEDSFFDQFIAGKVSEHDIDSNVILPFNNMKKQKRIYISGVVVRDPGGYIGSKRARIMLWTMLEYIKKVFGLRMNRTYYAVGITKESERLLRAMGFQICCEKGSRRDECNLYKTDLDKETWNKLLNKLGDLSKMVSYELDL
jgi:hypothetical protein